MIDRVRVLLIEDDDADAARLVQLLRQRREPRADVTRAVRLQQARGLLLDQAYDVAVLDLGLPDSIGPSAVGALRLAAATMPIIVVCDDHQALLGQESVRRGADDFLTRQQACAMDGEVLVRAIRYAIERRRLLAAAPPTARRAEQRCDGFVDRLAAIAEADAVAWHIDATAPEPIRPAVWQALVHGYEMMLDQCVAIAVWPGTARDPDEPVVDFLDRATTVPISPADLLRIHLEATATVLRRLPQQHRDIGLVEGEVLLLRAMALLAVRFARDMVPAQASFAGIGPGSMGARK